MPRCDDGDCGIGWSLFFTTEWLEQGDDGVADGDELRVAVGNSRAAAMMAVGIVVVFGAVDAEVCYNNHQAGAVGAKPG